jgi:hypothetical protein
MRAGFPLLAVAASLMAAPFALAFDEQEPNDEIALANPVPVAASGANVDGVRSSTSDVDFYRFTGLAPGRAYDLTLDNTLLGIGWFDTEGTLLESVAFEGFPQLLDLVPDENGELLVGVCGHAAGESIFDCSEASEGQGPYLLTLPEPDPALLAVVSLVLVCALRARARA